MTQWYVINVVSGSEKSVKQNIEDQILKYDAKSTEGHTMGSLFKQIVVPVIEVPSVKRGKNIKIEKKFMPGYILIQMDMTDKSWHLVKNIPKVTGFLGSKSTPKALSQSEVDNIFNTLDAAVKSVKASTLFEIGESIKIVDGPFDTFTGIVEEVDAQKNRLKVSVSIFAKATIVELGFSQVKKNI